MKERLSGGSYLHLKHLLYRSTTNNNVTSEQNINTAAAEPHRGPSKGTEEWSPDARWGRDVPLEDRQTKQGRPDIDAQGQQTGLLLLQRLTGRLQQPHNVHVRLSGHGQDTPVALEAPIVAQPRAYTWVSIGPRCYQQRYCGARQGCGRNLGARRHFSNRQ